MSIFLEKCFGCLRLRTGVLIIGYLYLIISLVLFIMHTILIVVLRVSYTRTNARDASLNVLVVIQMAILSYVLSVVLLVYGATKGNRHHMLHFVTITALLCAYAICYELFCCLFLVAVLFSWVVSFVFVSVNSFVMYVIISHHQELKKLTLDNREDASDEVSIVNAV